MGTEDKGWAIVEVMGHRKLAGYVTDDGGLVRVDVYVEAPERLVGEEVQRIGADPIVSQWYGQAAIYCITAVTSDTALAFARANRVSAPVGRWELPAPPPPPASAELGEDRYDEADEAEVYGHEDHEAY
jgi:hypothetical protein